MKKIQKHKCFYTTLPIIYNKFEKKFYTLEELNSLILKFIIQKANRQLNTEIKDIVITIPAHFNQIQRDSIVLSTKLANWNVLFDLSLSIIS